MSRRLDSRRFGRRDALRHGGALLGGMALAGVAPRAFAQAPARIRFGGYVESQEQLKQTLATLKAYTDRNPGVEIVPEFTNFGAFTDKLATEAAGGNAPDMFSVNVDLLGEYARRGVLTPLNPWIPKPLDLSDYVDGAIKAGTLKGELFAVPNDCIAPAITLKPAVFEETGVPLPDQMWTWEQMAETAVAISKEKGPRFWGLEDAGANYIPCDIFMRSRGKSMFTPERQFGFDREDMAEWFAYWARLRDAGGVPPGEIQALATGDDLALTGLISGRAAMFPSLTDNFAGLQALTEDPLELHMLPNGFQGGTLTQHHYTYAGNSTGLWSKSPHKDRMVDIIRFMHFEPAGIELYYRGSGMVPASKSGRAALAKEGTDSDRKILAYIDLLQQNPAAPRYPGVTGMTNMLRRANEAVAFGKMTPQQAADQFIGEAKARL
ncbi:extracellular solute-binding protein [Inquilinus limosus]|uniref:ABC transporter substrate-binding protein n=1 Tax=Inquilinus limosus TaxID=171674 RepID=UPI003F147E61